VVVVVAITPSARSDDPLKSWRTGVTVREVAAAANEHTIHAYYVTCPESPDGTKVLFYASPTRNGEYGDLRVLDRATGKQTVVASGIETEDAHRAACQQWISGGKRIAYHEVRDGKWRVCTVDLATLEKRELAIDRQLAFGSPAVDVLPIYSPHWNPGDDRDLELIDAVSGERRTAVTMSAVRQEYGDWLNERFGDKPTSIFFPVLSPDGNRVFFKIASATGGESFRSKKASDRDGLVCYDLARDKFLFQTKKWGHPAWFPDSRRIIQTGNLWLDSGERGKTTRIAGLPVLGAAPHPSVSPDNKLFVMDGSLGRLGGDSSEMGVVVCDLRGGADAYQILHRFHNSRGAESWRKNHPHPTFSRDGRRIYFNVSEAAWTSLYVAECKAQ
jgi:Tol biopolymer transport system component